MFYTVGETAKRLGVATSTLRFYDRQGLLPFVERSSGGIRMFKDSDLETLRVIECLKRSGLQLKDVRAYIQLALEGDSTIAARRELFERQRERVLRQLRELEETRDFVEYKCWFYETAAADGTTERVSGLPDDELPERFRETRRRLHGCDSARR